MEIDINKVTVETDIPHSKSMGQSNDIIIDFNPTESHIGSKQIVFHYDTSTLNKNIIINSDVPLTPQECDYYFETREDFVARMPAIIAENNNDLSQKTFGFGDGVTSLPQGFRNTNIISTPKAIYANNLTSLSQTFYNCFSLKTISKDLFKNTPRLYSILKCFYGCRSIDKVPAELFANKAELNDCAEAFIGCEGIIEIGDNVFSGSSNIKNFDSTFSRCTSVVTVGTGIFDGCVNVTSFYGCFYNCPSITSALPDVWNKAKFPNVTDGSGYASDSKKAANYFDIPEEFGGPKLPQNKDYYFETKEDFLNRRDAIIAENNNDLSQKTFGFSDSVNDLSEIFKGTNIIGAPKEIVARKTTSFYKIFCDCASLEHVTSEIFYSCLEVESFEGAFYNCTSLDRIPYSIFGECNKVTTFNSCFKFDSTKISLIKYIPQNLFDNCTKAQYFTNCFYNCSSITSALPDVWNKAKFPNVTDGSGYGYNCTSATNYGKIPSNFGGPSS